MINLNTFANVALYVCECECECMPNFAHKMSCTRCLVGACNSANLVCFITITTAIIKCTIACAHFNCMCWCVCVYTLPSAVSGKHVKRAQVNY